VLDWSNAKYGDFLYDVAYLDWQSPDRGYRERYRALYAGRGQRVPRFDARVSCYQAWIGLDALRFCARLGRRDWYDLNRAKLLELVETAPPR
jgi:hygromycin-B 4-O-kinase